MNYLQYKIKDVDNDKEINSDDINLLNKYALGMTVFIEPINNDNMFKLCQEDYNNNLKSLCDFLYKLSNANGSGNDPVILFEQILHSFFKIINDNFSDRGINMCFTNISNDFSQCNCDLYKDDSKYLIEKNKVIICDDTIYDKNTELMKTKILNLDYDISLNPRDNFIINNHKFIYGIIIHQGYSHTYYVKINNPNNNVLNISHDDSFKITFDKVTILNDMSSIVVLSNQSFNNLDMRIHGNYIKSLLFCDFDYNQSNHHVFNLSNSNNCWINASIQALYNTPLIYRYLSNCNIGGYYDKYVNYKDKYRKLKNEMLKI